MGLDLSELANCERNLWPRNHSSLSNFTCDYLGGNFFHNFQLNENDFYAILTSIFWHQTCFYGFRFNRGITLEMKWPPPISTRLPPFSKSSTWLISFYRLLLSSFRSFFQLAHLRSISIRYLYGTDELFCQQVLGATNGLIVKGNLEVLALYIIMEKITGKI